MNSCCKVGEAALPCPEDEASCSGDGEGTSGVGESEGISWVREGEGTPSLGKERLYYGWEKAKAHH